MTQIINRAEIYIRAARKSKDPQLALIQMMLGKKKVLDLAPLILAYQHVTGIVPQNPSPLWQGALELAAVAIEAAPDVIVCADDAPITDYDILPPSDRARQEAHALRKATGAGEYKGPRFIRKYPRPKGLPLHHQTMLDCQAN